jgi:thioredoxin reductase (NADPH)
MMTRNGIYDLIIVGGGPGGLTAAIYGMRAALSTVLVEKGYGGGQIAISGEVENYPGFENISGFDLSQKFINHAKSYGVEMIQQEVMSVDPGLDHHEVRLGDGRVLRGHAIILAMGGSPRKLNVPGEDTHFGRGVSYCATCDGFFYRDKTVVVVGGGDSAAEESLYLAKITKQVYIVHRRDALRASRILQQRLTAECKIEILWNTVVSEILAGEDGVRAVSLKDTVTGEGRELACEGVFVFVGFIPNNSPVPAGIKMTPEGYAVTDEKCETAIPGIYAIGDLRDKYARQIVLATGDGCTAALAAAHYVEDKKATAACELPDELKEATTA